MKTSEISESARETLAKASLFDSRLEKDLGALMSVMQVCTAEICTRLDRLIELQSAKDGE